MAAELPPDFDLANYRSAKEIPPEIIEALFGTPEQIKQEAREERCNTALRERPDFIEKYQGEWVALHAGAVVAHDPEIEVVRRKVAHLRSE